MALSTVAAAWPFVDAGQKHEVIGARQDRQGKAEIDRMVTPTANTIGTNNGAKLCIGEGLSDMGRHAAGKFAHEVMIRLGGFRCVWRGTRSP